MLTIRGTWTRLAGRLPRGTRDFFRQVAIWLGFAAGYEIARALAHPGAGEALRNANRVVDLERRLGGLYDLDLQRRALEAGHGLIDLAGLTYWLSQFAVVSAALLWVYLRRNHAYRRLRNTIFAVNTLGLLGYILVPTAPPRLLPGAGFVDTLAGSAVSFESGLVERLANPYAAMPSLHAADALVVAIAVAAVVRSWALRTLVLLWPLWVWFSLLATGNHFWLDVAAGAALGAVGSGTGPILAHVGRLRCPCWRKKAAARSGHTRTASANPPVTLPTP